MKIPVFTHIITSFQQISDTIEIRNEEKRRRCDVRDMNEKAKIVKDRTPSHNAKC